MGLINPFYADAGPNVFEVLFIFGKYLVVKKMHALLAQLRDIFEEHAKIPGNCYILQRP